jgi:hypothetical protein
MSLRMTGNRVGQVLAPLLASLIATVAGMAGILLVSAFALPASGTAQRPEQTAALGPARSHQ